jgi:hypothetical protein
MAHTRQIHTYASMAKAMHPNLGITKETIRMHTTKPPIPMTPELAAVMALATPLIHSFATEIAKLPVEEQQRRIAKVLAAMRDESKPHRCP